MLTRKQRDLLLFIHERMSTGDIAPSFEEMKDALGLKSKSGIHRLIGALEERGYLERMPNRARALEVRKLPEGHRPSPNDNTPAARVSNAIESVRATVASTLESIPLMGKIAAGTPIEAVRDETATVDIPPALLGRHGEHYALTVDGDSMIKAGINDGDTVIIRQADTASNGTIVVALVDDSEVTLKRFRRSGSKVILEPENDAYEPRVLEPERVRVQGHLVGLMRTYH